MFGNVAGKQTHGSVELVPKNKGSGDLPEVDGQQYVPKQRLDDDTRGAGRAHNGPVEPYEPGDMPPGPAAAVTPAPNVARCPRKFNADRSACWLNPLGDGIDFVSYRTAERHEKQIDIDKNTLNDRCES